MGFLNQSISQMRDLFASMTPAARITAALLLGVIGVSLAYLFQGYAGGSKEFLFNGEMLQPREADAVESAIAQAQLTEAERQGNRILVPRGQKAAYLAAVADGGALPANFDTLLLDESNELSWLTDTKTRDARMKATRERQLSMLVRMMDGISEAQVLYDVREPTGFERKQITATISVRPAPGEVLTATRERMIRLAVCKAIAGLEPNDIAILNLADSSQTEGGGELSADAIDLPYFQAKLAYEQIMKAKVEDVLKHIPGVRVQVTAELDETLTAESRIIKPEGDPQTVNEETDQSEQRTTQTEDRGRPGLTVNGPTGTPPDEEVAKNEEIDSTNTRTAQNWVPTNEEVRTTTGLVPQHVRAAIAIPSDFLAKVWRERNPDAPADQPPAKADLDPIALEYEDSVKKIVSQLFPREPQDEPYPNVQVTVFQSLTPAPVVEPTMMSKAMWWAGGNSGSLIMAGLALVSLVMLRSMVKSIPPAETSVILQTSAEGGEARAAEAATLAAAVEGTDKPSTTTSRPTARSPLAAGRRRQGPPAAEAQEGAQFEGRPDRPGPRRSRRGGRHPEILDQQRGMIARTFPLLAVGMACESQFITRNSPLSMTYERIRRAAILVASLDEPLAEQLLSGLPPADRERVLAAAERIEEIDPDEQRDVLAEFRRLSRGNRSDLADGVGVEFSSSGSEDASAAERVAADKAGAGGPELSEADAAAMAELLSHEHPQIVAAALARLRDDESAAVFAALPAYLQAETLERLASLAPPDEEAVLVVESQLAQRLQQRREHQARSAAGAELVRKILARTPPAQRVFLLERLGRQTEQQPAPAAAVDPIAQQARLLVQAVRRVHADAPEAPPLADRSEELALVSDEALVGALRQAGEQVVLRALAASGDEFLDRVAGMLPRRQARKLRSMLHKLGPVRLADLHEAQHELLRLAHETATVESVA